MITILLKMTGFLWLICFVNTSIAQHVDGTYLGFELREYRVDSSGEIISLRSSEYSWYYSSTVKIQGERITILKRLVYNDKNGVHHYADSATNTYQFVGKLVKVADRIIAKTVLVNKPAGYIYINGKWIKESNPSNPNAQRTESEQQSTFRWFQYSDGRFWIYRESIEQDLILKPDISGIWINNKFYKKIKP